MASSVGNAEHYFARVRFNSSHDNGLRLLALEAAKVAFVDLYNTLKRCRRIGDTCTEAPVPSVDSRVADSSKETGHVGVLLLLPAPEKALKVSVGQRIYASGRKCSTIKFMIIGYL